MDIKGTYLNGTLKETIYMHQPNGFNDSTRRACHLIKTLYGLKQSSQEWKAEFDKKMQQHGYKQLHTNPCMYTHSGEETTTIITIWVNDLLLFANLMEIMKEMKKDICTEWEVMDMGEPNKIVGIEISQMPERIYIFQKRSITDILERQELTDASSVQMPLNPHTKIGPNLDGNEGNRSNSYVKLLGELQYIANCMHPDIAFMVNWLTLYTANPSMQHVTMLKQILRYLSGTQTYGIIYNHVPESTLTFKGYADVSYQMHDDGKSTTGYSMSLKLQEARSPGNWWSSLLPLNPPQRQNILCYRKRERRHSGWEIYTKSWDLPKKNQLCWSPIVLAWSV